ncbi:MAG: RagB/SusD family nutrient uptake outer membrane protein [Chitinophagaceae bacterium]
MKSLKNIFSILLIALALFAGSCKKSLELAPYNAFGDQTAFQTPERCLLALYGVYDAAQSGDYDPLNGTAHSVRGYPFGAASIAQGEMRGEDMVNIATFYQITYQATYSTVSPNNVNMWINLYLLINKANLSIDGFRAAAAKGTINGTVAAQYEAECRFLRAMAHHELLVNFSRPYLDGNGNMPGVPYRDYATGSSAALERVRSQPRDSVSVCYTKILADLDYAEANLGATIPVTVTGASLPAGVNTIRATKAAAIALKMRVKLHKGDWAGVIAEGNKIIPTTPSLTSYPGFISPIGGWKLETLPNGPFTNNASGESMFSIRNDALDNTGVNAALAQMLGPNVPGRGLVAIGPSIFNLAAWRCDDARRATSGSGQMIIQGLSNANTQSYFTKKYVDYIGQSDYAPMIRYAEVLLTQAEAEARLNGITTKALQLINEVRNRALPGGPGNFTTPPANTYIAANFANATALVKAILDERRIEFIGEGKRWGDIHRLAMDPNFSTAGIPAKAVNGYANLAAYGCGLPVPALGQAAIPYSDFRFLWPIPQDERVSNPIVAQNPGY